MSIGGSGRSMSEVNVTPMIDILLVLLIIFMVIVPVTPRGLSALVPQAPRGPIDPSRPIVVQILDHPGALPTYRINDVDVTHADLLSKLTEIYANRAERVMFVKSDAKVNFAYVADVIDIGKAASVDHIGLMTQKVGIGQ